MPFKSFGFTGGRYEQLKVFCRQVMKTRETPDLISLVAGETAYMNYCREITNADEQYRKRFASFCRQSGFDPDEIRIRICLAATALGVCKQADYYGILDVSPGADDTAIKQAYRKKAKMLHPDKCNGDESNSDEFVELHAAYVHLSNPGLRKVYDEMRRCIGYWIEGDKVPASSKRRPGIGRIVGWMCVLGGGMLIVAYAFDVYQSKSTYLASQQTSEAWLEESAAAFVAVTTNKAATGETAKPMAEQGDVSRAETDDGAPSQTVPASMPKPKSATFSVKTKKIGVEKTVATTGASLVKKAVSVKTAARTVNKRKPPPRNGWMVSKIAKAAVPKKVGRPVSGAAPPDLSTVSEAQKSHVAQTVTMEKKMNAKAGDLLQKQRVLSFLQNFTKTYEEKDLEQFRTFFANNALEQGRPFETLLPTYQQTFDSVEALKYKIELKSFSMERGGHKIYVEGNFTARYQLPEEDWGSCSGLIRMELLDAAKGLLVSRMDYEVDDR